MAEEKPTLHRAGTMEKTAEEAKKYLAGDSDIKVQGRTRGEKKARTELSALLEPASSKEVFLTQDEFDAYRKQLVNIFRHIDQNGDGKLDEHEMYAMLQSLGKRTTRRQVTLLMRQLDTDKNGTVDLQEFEDFMLQKKNYKLLEDVEEDSDEEAGEEEEEGEEEEAEKAGKAEEKGGSKKEGTKAASSSSSSDEPKSKRQRKARTPKEPKPRKPLSTSTPPTTTTTATVSFGGVSVSAEMQQAYELGGLLVKDRLSSDEKALLSRAAPDAVLVVPGGADHAELVVKGLELPVQVGPLTSVPELRGDQILILNCCGHVPPTEIPRISKFVQDGGLLITTDHALSHAASAFPGYIEKGTGTPSAGSVAINHRSTDPLVRGFWDEDIDPTWHVDGGAYSIRIINNDAVTVLLGSEELKAKCGEGAVMVAFQPAGAKGRVVHMISHIYMQKQQSRLRGGALRLASEYAEKKGGTLETLNKIRSAEGLGGLAFEQVQSASTAMDFVLQALLAQLRPTD